MQGGVDFHLSIIVRYTAQLGIWASAIPHTGAARCGVLVYQVLPCDRVREKCTAPQNTALAMRTTVYVVRIYLEYFSLRLLYR